MMRHVPPALLPVRPGFGAFGEKIPRKRVTFLPQSATWPDGAECERMLGDAIGDLLPSALAVALSPIPIVAIVLVLGAPHARTAGPAFAIGWIAGLLAVSVVVVLLGDGLAVL